MNSGFASVVEEVQKLSLQEKEELRMLLEKYVFEERRKEIYNNYQSALKEGKSGNLKTAKDIIDFKKMMEG